MPTPHHQLVEPPDRRRLEAVDGQHGASRPERDVEDRSSHLQGSSSMPVQEHAHDVGAQASGAVAPGSDDDARVEVNDGSVLGLPPSPAKGRTPIVSRPPPSTSGSVPAASPAPPARPDHHPPSTSSSSSNSTLPSTPSHHPMRRVARLSPNSRNERAAPSSLAGSGDYFSSVASTARSHRRQGSLPPPSSRRTRANSLSASTTPVVEQPGPSSRSSRHLDPGEHWLSEDEASEVTLDFDRLRRGRRRRPGSDDDVERRGEPDRKLPMPSGLAVDGPSLPEFQRSSTAKPSHVDAPSTTLDHVGPTIAVVLPKLASLLTCPSCHRLLHNPTTIACGHSHCLVCPPPPRDPYATPPIETASTGATEFTFSIPAQQVAHASTGSAHSSALSTPTQATQLNSNQLYRTLSSASTASSVSSRRSSIVEPPPMTCPVPTCAFPHSQLVMRHPPLTVDYTLRKLVDLVERVAGPALLADLVKTQHADARARVDGSLAPLFSDVRLGSEAPMDVRVEPPTPEEPGHVTRHGSGSSGGGEDEPMAEDDAKRAHKSGADYRQSKKRREIRSPSPVEAPVVPTLSSTSASSSAPKAGAPSYAAVSSTLFAQLQNECECQICFQLFNEPVTAPCGHSYCRNCLARSYDHSDKCPMCRTNLPPQSYFRWQRANHALTAVIEAALPDLAAERAAAVKEEELALLEHVPIFVCTSAWPGIKSYLHIFEPRYRLMIRRALETPDKSFGMVLPLPNGGPDAVNEFGTMLRITSCQMLDDGRLILETVGTHRFRLVERGVVDGYNVGKIERVDDVSPEQEAALERAAIERSEQQLDDDVSWMDPNPTPSGARPPMTGNQELTTQQLMHICLDFIKTLRAGSAPWVIERLNRTVGEIPTNAHDFTWFAAEVFPVEDHVKVALLQITSVRERLRLIVFWIEQIRSSWWYSRGCTIM
ncbi:hypothetical protein JCM8208_007789 [Rhodotorula glutinis]